MFTLLSEIHDIYCMKMVNGRIRLSLSRIWYLESFILEDRRLTLLPLKIKGEKEKREVVKENSGADSPEYHG